MARSSFGHFPNCSPDVKIVVTARQEHPARLRYPSAGRPIAELLGRTDRVREGAFRPNAKFIATASDDLTARIWEASTGQELAQMRETAVVLDVPFSADSRFVMTPVGYTARIYLCQVCGPLEELLALVEARVTCELTC